jgi:penicillin-binding protein 2
MRPSWRSLDPARSSNRHRGRGGRPVYGPRWRRWAAPWSGWSGVGLLSRLGSVGRWSAWPALGRSAGEPRGRHSGRRNAPLQLAQPPPQKPDSQRSRLRLGLVTVVVTGLFCALFARLYYLEVLNTKKYSQLVVQDSLRTVHEPGPRGLILDRAGQPIVGNQTTEAVTLARQVAAQHPAVVSRLAKVLHMTPKAVQAQLNNNQYSPYVPVPVKTGVPMATIIYLGEHQSQFPGVSTEQLAERRYPYGATASQLLGYVAPVDAAELKTLKGQGYQPGDMIGQSGVEASYQSWLRGKQGTTRLEVNRQGLVVGTASSTPPRQGDSVQLSLDLGLQQMLQKALAHQIQGLRRGSVTGTPEPAPGGAAVVLDPRNGNVLAMASYPTYNPSVWVGGISQQQYQALLNPANDEPMLNRAIEGLYVPGSVFKLATATAALNYGLITPSYIYDDTGVFTFPGCTAGVCTLHNAGGEVAGPIDVTQALSQSIDTFFYNLGYMFYVQQHKYGPMPIQKTAEAYGLGRLTGIDLPGEAQGRVDSLATREQLCALAPKAYSCPPSWTPGDQVEMAFGQGATVVTPIELAQAFATFANGGTVYQPHVAADIVNSKGHVVKRIEPKVTGHVPMSPANHQAMLQGFIGAVRQPGGTAYSTFQGFNFSRMQVAGKTGTGTTNYLHQPDGNFVAFAGKDIHHPQYVVAVMIERAGYGAQTGAPVARQALQYLMDHPPRPITQPKPAPVLLPAARGSHAGHHSRASTSTTAGASTSTTSGASTSTTAPAPTTSSLAGTGATPTSVAPGPTTTVPTGPGPPASTAPTAGGHGP